ncbi:C40 family peptidase [Herbidospora mongoliensis]|uniref:C40 family peptidase n=1 Tax=Herbidospora mongoliensis TaxID=688067 RepID=UPI000835D157|nr:peptidoglycan-binding protein [Herbidospora mongoliensis]
MPDPPLTQAALDILRSHIGYRERGTNDTIFNREFGKLPGYPHDGYGYPWCSSFLSVCLERAGLDPGVDFPWTAGCEAGVVWFKARDRFGSTPRVGALVYYGPRGGTHVEWVAEVTQTTITTIGGNTSGSLDGRFHNGDGVYRKTVARSSDRIYGYGYPVYPAPGPVAATMTPTEALMRQLPLIKVGSKGWAVKRAFYLLISHGQKLDPKVLDDTVFTPQMETAVKAVQKQNGKKVDGEIGSETWAVLVLP